MSHLDFLPALIEGRAGAFSRRYAERRTGAESAGDGNEFTNLEHDMKRSIWMIAVLTWSVQAWADDSRFSTHLHAKFKVKGCTICHDFFEKDLNGLSFNSHKNRPPKECADCHERSVTGFIDEDEWFAQPKLYTSAMNATQTCEAVKAVLHADFKTSALVAKQLKKHLFEDPRVLWAIEGATPGSGNLPKEKRQTDLIKGGMDEWKTQVAAWLNGGMKCE